MLSVVVDPITMWARPKWKEITCMGLSTYFTLAIQQVDFTNTFNISTVRVMMSTYGQLWFDHWIPKLHLKNPRKYQIDLFPISISSFESKNLAWNCLFLVGLIPQELSIVYKVFCYLEYCIGQYWKHAAHIVCCNDPINNYNKNIK